MRYILNRERTWLVFFIISSMLQYFVISMYYNITDASEHQNIIDPSLIRLLLHQTDNLIHKIELNQNFDDFPWTAHPCSLVRCVELIVKTKYHILLQLRSKWTNKLGVKLENSLGLICKLSKVHWSSRRRKQFSGN